MPLVAVTDVTVAKAYGKYSVRDNVMEIQKGCDILVATTGRAKDFIGKKRVSILPSACQLHSSLCTASCDTMF